MIQFNEIVVADPEILGGEPVFRGTRVPVRALLDHLAAGLNVSEFREEFPSVSRDQAEAALSLASDVLTARATSTG